MMRLAAWRAMPRSAPLFLSLFSSVAIAAMDPPPQNEDEWFDFVPGRFVFVGREPDNGATYAGTALIVADQHRFTLQRTIGSRTWTAEGRIEVPGPPGEGKVLRFRWNDKVPQLMTCLVQGDLDNYARLSCLWQRDGNDHNKLPGLEAYFSSEGWPKGQSAGATGR